MLPSDSILVSLHMKMSLGSSLPITPGWEWFMSYILGRISLPLLCVITVNLSMPPHSLMHYFVMCCSCTGIFHFLNQTPTDWFSKQQNQVETTIFGSESIAAHQAIRQIVDLRCTLHMCGVPLEGPSWLLGTTNLLSTHLPGHILPWVNA